MYQSFHNCFSQLPILLVRKLFLSYTVFFKILSVFITHVILLDRLFFFTRSFIHLKKVTVYSVDHLLDLCRNELSFIWTCMDQSTISHIFDDVKVVVRMLKRRDQLLKSSCALLVQLRQLLLDTGDVTRAVLLLRADMDLADKATFKAQTKR
jgi:hypothetical protein